MRLAMVTQWLRAATEHDRPGTRRQELPADRSRNADRGYGRS